MIKAYWLSRDLGLVMLSQDWKHPQKMPYLVINPGNQEVHSIERVPLIEFGRRSGYFRLGKVITFVSDPLYAHQSEKMQDERIFVAGDFNQWSAVGDPKWELQKNTIDGVKCYTLSVPWQLCYPGGRGCSFKFVSHGWDWLDIYWDAPNKIQDAQGNQNYELRVLQTGHHLFYFKYNNSQCFTKIQTLQFQDKSCFIDYGPWLLSNSTELPLGAIVEKDHTCFRLFAPRALSASVTFFESLEKDATHHTHVMGNVDCSVWEYKHRSNLHGWYYYYNVSGDNIDACSHFDSNFKILDPYAKAVVAREGPGIVIDSQRFPPIKTNYQTPPWDDLVVLEVHIRDVLAKADLHLSDQERLGFSGLIRWIRSKNNYIKHLGVNAVELQPIQEFDNRVKEEYHWGYMPVNYFSPASAYTEAPEKGSQIREFQELVAAFHQEGLAVILDVVYNHLGEPNHLLFIDKRYYFETTEAGDLLNWSGCGNDFRAHTPMGRRLITDSLIYLIQQFDVDGFRFDLADLLGIDVLSHIECELKKIKPSVILIAEPWSFKGHIAHQLKSSGYASWNDGFRKFIHKYVLGEGNQDGFKYYIKGSLDFLSRFPAQSLNYTESHDDLCWIDKITENADNNGSRPTINDIRRTHLMGAILMASIGIPMLSAGQDFLRSKHGVQNTYKRGDLNALDYDQWIENRHSHYYFQQWIQFRLSEEGKPLRPGKLPTKDYLRFFPSDSASSMAVLYNADKSLGPRQLLFAVNPHNYPLKINIEDILLSQLIQIADNQQLDGRGILTANLKISEQLLSLPPLSCGLWKNI